MNRVGAYSDGPTMECFFALMKKDVLNRGGAAVPRGRALDRGH